LDLFVIAQIDGSSISLTAKLSPMEEYTNHQRPPYPLKICPVQ